MRQLEFELPELDRKRTKAAVEAALEKYRIYQTITFEEREANVTQTLSDIPRSTTNKISDQTGNIAAYNIDEPARRRAYCERIDKVVGRLHPKERLLIRERYLQEDYVLDYTVYNQVMHVSAQTYDKIRWKAFYKIALALDIAVVKEKAT